MKIKRNEIIIALILIAFLVIIPKGVEQSIVAYSSPTGSGIEITGPSEVAISSNYSLCY